MKINPLRNTATFVNFDTRPLAYYDVSNRNDIAVSSVAYHIF